MKEKVETWRIVSDIKNGLVSQVVGEIGERTIDVSEDNVNVFAIEHHCNEGLWGTLNTMSADGFTMGDDFDGIQLMWKDMIVEDLAMVLDYLRTGHW
jgi:hypothetical protein